MDQVLVGRGSELATLEAARQDGALDYGLVDQLAGAAWAGEDSGRSADTLTMGSRLLAQLTSSITASVLGASSRGRLAARLHP
ncbi:MAG: hypothetical protein M3Y91_05260 [Actinomycetota bacterium]|nr:hypothetical protein [Actinomycetota bacterium]